MNAWPMRSWLYVPGDDQKKIAKASSLDADVCVIDLEDGVAPPRKEIARRIVAELIPALDWGRSRVFVRIDLGGDWRRGVEAAAGANGVLIPKASDPGLVAEVAGESRAVGIADVALIPTEDAAGVLATMETFKAVPYACAAMWGTEDLSASLGLRSVFEPDGQLPAVLQTAKGHFQLAAAAAQIPAIDTPHLNIVDLEGVDRAARAAARNGFSGKQAIHPSHVEAINAAFLPTEKEIDYACRIVSAFHEAGGGGALRIDDGMVDLPHLVQANRILAAAALFKGLTPH